MPEYTIIVIHHKEIRDTSYHPGTVGNRITGHEDVTVYQQRKEMDLSKIIMAVNGYTRTR